MTTTEVATLKRTELQAAACRQFGKSAAAWTGRATNEELREALMTEEVPAKFANGNGSHPDLALAVAAAINPLLQAQLDEERVMELIEARVAELATLVEAKLNERQTVTTFEVHRPDGTTINVGRTHRQFEELLSYQWHRANGEGCVSPQGGRRSGAARQTGVLPRSPSPAQEAQLRVAPQARRMDRRVHRRSCRPARRHLHRRSGHDGSAGVA